MIKKILFLLGLIIFFIGGVTGYGTLPNPNPNITSLILIVSGALLMVVSFYMKKKEPKSDWPSDSTLR
jgi:uncharacterized membrane-anchored protein